MESIEHQKKQLGGSFPKAGVRGLYLSSNAKWFRQQVIRCMGTQSLSADSSDVTLNEDLLGVSTLRQDKEFRHVIGDSIGSGPEIG